MANSNGWGDGAANNAIGWGQGANNAIGWGDIHADSWAGLTDISGLPTTDPDAQAFITAAAITDSTQQSAINQLVVDLKGYSIWTKMKALYPFVGGTASQHKFNLKDPRDLDAAFRLVFNGGWTHSTTGATPNGTNGYASTKLIPNNVLTLNNTHISLYSRTSTITNAERDLAAFTNSGLPAMALGTNTGVFISDQYDFNQRISSSIASATGFYIGSRTTSTSHKLYKNGSVLGTNTNLNTQTLPPLSLFLGAANISSAGQEFPSNYSNKQYAFASIGDGLTDTEAANFYTAVQAFQTTIGRSIGTQTVSDADAQAFVTNAGIVDQVEANAINNLVIGLKADSLWTKMKAVYPFVGGTASAHKFNLKDPQDTDAAFRLTFSGGVTHTSTGITFNGTNGYADTKLKPKDVLSANNVALSFYKRDTGIPSGVTMIGTRSSNYNTDLTQLSVDWYLNTYYSRIYDQSNGQNTASISNGTGLFMSNRTSSSIHKIFRNGSQLGTTATTSGGSNANLDLSVLLAAFNRAEGVTFYASCQYAFASINDGLTDTEAANFYTAVQAFQVALSRNI